MKRNADKKDALSTKSFVALIAKIIFDSISRIMIFGIWMFVLHNGHFNTYCTVTVYYTCVLLLIIFNLLFNWDTNFCSMRFWIGIFIYLSKMYVYNYHLGIILNSLNSVLSFNNVNLNSILEKNNDEKHLHESTFVKQTIYFMLYGILQLG